MKIRTKVVGISAVFLVILLSVFSFLLFTKEAVEHETAESAVSREISLGVFELAILTNDYLLYGEDRSVEQWNLISDRLKEIVIEERRAFEYESERDLLQKIASDHEELEILFKKMQTLRSEGADEDRINQVANHLFLHAQEMAFITDELRIYVDEEVAELQERFHIVSFAVTSILGVLILLFAFYVLTGIVRHISHLLDAVTRLKEGEVGAHAEVHTKDELGVLATTFNDMSDAIKKSHSTLEKQIQERTKELEKRTSEAEDISDRMVGRELKMKELKEEIKRLKGGNK